MRSNQSVWTRLFVGLLVLALVALPRQSAGATSPILYAKPAGKTTGSCLTWGNACTLQRALSLSFSGYQIWVVKGTYKPSKNDRTATFTLKPGVAVYGGFAGSETKLTQRKPAVNLTILSGNIGLVAKKDDNSYHVVTASATDNTTVLDGFTIRDGYAVNSTRDFDSYGAGMYIDTGSPTLGNLIFTVNTAYNLGGGIYNLNGSPTLTNVTFTTNSVGVKQANGSFLGGIGGGGMYNGNGSPHLTNVKFTTNAGNTNGGGMYNNGGTPTLTNVTFTGNTATYGGGLENQATSPVLTDVTFSGNKAMIKGVGGGFGGGMFNTLISSPTLNNVTFSANTAVNGGGMYNNDSSAPFLTNVTFSGNTASKTGGGMANQASSPILLNTTFTANRATLSGNAMYNGDSSPILSNSIFWGDGTLEIFNDATSLPTINDSIVAHGCPASSTCNNVLNANPVLGALSSNGTTAHPQTRSLGLGSAAIDAGGSTVACATNDERGVPRPPEKCDIGAYEVKTAQFTSQALNDGQVLETGVGTKLGGTRDSTSPTINVGDDDSNRQIRGVLSFNTASLPDGATVVLATTQILDSGASTGDPFGSLGNLRIDVQKPYFGTGVALVSSDFQAAGALLAGQFDSTPEVGWYTGSLETSTALAKVNKTGTTQLRLRFDTATDNNSSFDYLSFYSGDDPTETNRPTLTVYYNP